MPLKLALLGQASDAFLEYLTLPILPYLTLPTLGKVRWIGADSFQHDWDSPPRTVPLHQKKPHPAHYYRAQTQDS